MNSSHAPFYMQIEFALVSIAEVTNDPHISVAFNHNHLCLAHISFQLIWYSSMYLSILDQGWRSLLQAMLLSWKKQENKNQSQNGS